jgi:PAS domain S-box-containing protein
VTSGHPEDFHRWISEELFDHVPLAICVVNQEFRVVEANNRFTELYGDWHGRFCYDVYKDRKERCIRCGASKTFRDGKTRQREEEGVDRQGNPTHYVVNIVPVLQENGEVPYVIEISRDVAELKTLQRQKLEAERLAAVGQTVAGLAHGIKNLIMGLEGGMYVVNSGLRSGNEERLRKGWQMLEEDIGRISSFMKEFLEFAKGRQPRAQTIQPNEVARKVVARFRERAARSGVELQLDLEDLEEASMDEEGLHTCLTNLVLNAIDACVMSTNEIHLVVVSTRERDGVLIFEVRDNGCGMDYEIKQRVFTNFFSTKASGKGTGLGLLTTRKIVQEHGGKVSFDSTEGEGSVFRLEFPRDSLPRPQPDGEAAGAEGG